MSNLPIVNRRLIQGDTIIFPITSEQNIVGLKNRFAIISPQQPQGQFVERQVWLDISGEQDITFGINENNAQLTRNEHLSFGNIEEHENLTFEEREQHNQWKSTKTISMTQTMIVSKS